MHNEYEICLTHTDITWCDLANVRLCEAESVTMVAHRSTCLQQALLYDNYNSLSCLNSFSMLVHSQGPPKNESCISRSFGVSQLRIRLSDLDSSVIVQKAHSDLHAPTAIWKQMHHTNNSCANTNNNSCQPTPGRAKLSHTSCPHIEKGPIGSLTMQIHKQVLRQRRNSAAP